jgi:signal transduction histidine kinase
MVKSGQSSFRRTLLFRILLLSIPVLLTGEYVTYRKARSILMDTARLNLKESAVRKGGAINDLIESTRTNLMTASEAFSLQMDQPRSGQDFVNRLAQWNPKDRVQCIQLTNLQSGQVEASTCGNQRIEPNLDNVWSTQNQIILDPRSAVRISPVSSQGIAQKPGQLRQLNLVFSAPIYDSLGQLRYALSMQSALHRQETSSRGSLLGETMVIDQNGTILVHRNPDRIGKNILQDEDSLTLRTIVDRAIADSEKDQELFAFPEKNGEWLAAGYTYINVAVGAGEKHKWIIVATAPLDNVLSGLEEIKQRLVLLTIGLLLANLIATLFIARDLARPLEQLGDYALHIFQRSPTQRVPQGFQIRELNQLAEALDTMIQKLEERAEELETAWQEAQVANQLKSSFLATTSHELRTPLNAIINCVRLVKDGCCDDKEEELDFLQRADDAAIHLLKIINDLLDISKIEAGKVELNLQPVSIQNLCQHCLRMVQPSAESKHLDLTVEVDPQLKRVALDEQRVRQMVINLLSNAVKFTPEGGSVKLGARVGTGAELEKDVRPDQSPVNVNTPYLCLEVQDSGIGIPQERWHLLFRPFQQVDSSLTRRHEGTGLGLALTKRLAELHGGTISFQSVPDKGSTFRIWLPLREA